MPPLLTAWNRSYYCIAQTSALSTRTKILLFSFSKYAFRCVGPRPCSLVVQFTSNDDFFLWSTLFRWSRSMCWDSQTPKPSLSPATMARRRARTNECWVERGDRPLFAGLFCLLYANEQRGSLVCTIVLAVHLYIHIAREHVTSPRSITIKTDYWVFTYGPYWS